MTPTAASVTGGIREIGSSHLREPGTASFAYDATGRRTGKTINGTTTNFRKRLAKAVRNPART